MSRRQGAARFDVAPSTVVNWMKRADEEGRQIIGKVVGHRKFILEAELPRIGQAGAEAGTVVARPGCGVERPRLGGQLLRGLENCPQG